MKKVFEFLNEGKKKITNQYMKQQLANLDKLEGPLYGEWEKRVSENIISSFFVNENCLIEDDPRLDISKAEDIFRVSWLLTCPSGIEEIKVNIF